MALQKLADSPTVDLPLWELIRAKLVEEAEEKASKRTENGERPAWMNSLQSYLEQKFGFPYRTAKDLIWEHAVLLDHALRRVSVAHTWIKRADAERQTFAQDANQIQRLRPDVVEWLNNYCDRRSIDSGADGGYQIRKSAIDGWELVVKAWSAKECQLESQRIEVVHDIQRGLDSDDKWGDSRLFEELAVDAAYVVWHDDAGVASTEPLKKYVAATTARSNQQRFKVPAYRHPHAFLNPVWVDFGNSRWSISWSALTAVNETRKLTKKLASAKTDAAKQKINSQLQQKPELQAVTLGLWTGAAVENVKLRWQGNRLRRDLDLDHFGRDGVVVSRADRVSRATANASTQPVTVQGVFDQSDWNGRLQLNREELERLYHYLTRQSLALNDRKRWDDKAIRLWERLRWHLTTSAKLMPSGPFLDMVKQGLPDGWSWNEKRRFLNYEPNKSQKRTGRTRVQLARLPGLRVLSLDLGHRYAAACAVWETLSSENLQQACQGAGQIMPDQDAMFCLINTSEPKPRTTVYRRIGPDLLDGKPHPAPWARLDRQFLIKLQGEEQAARRATREEFEGYNRFRAFAGLAAVTAVEELDLNGATLKTPSITRLAGQALRDARLALRRLGDRARIAYSMTATHKPISGGRANKLSDWERVEYVQEALLQWHRLATSREFVSSTARERWDEWIVGKLHGPPLVQLPEEMSRPARSKSEETIQENLKGVATQLVDPSSDLCREMNKLWSDDWKMHEAAWKQQLRWLRQLVMPRLGQKPPKLDVEGRRAWKAKKQAMRGAGGLSYDRLRAFRGLYEVLKAFKMRPEPDDPRKNVPAAGSRDPGQFGRRILNQFEQLRMQRIKQLASRVVEAAMGVGAEPASNLKRMRGASVDPRFRPCHAVIVENLKNYRPEESRLRKVNKRLADWSAANVRKYIEEGCHLHGLLFDDVPAGYTSKQDSRTGLPGVRCEDVTRTAFMEAARRTTSDRPPSPFDQHRRTVVWWTREIERSETRSKERKADARDQLIIALAQAARADKDGTRLPDLLCIPRQGGELFLSSGCRSEVSATRPRMLQADLNAAANIGLAALIDPDSPAAWWRIKVSPTTGATVKGDFPGSPLFELPVVLLAESQRGGKRDRQNAFSNPGMEPLDSRPWFNQWEFWPQVLDRCCQRLRQWYGLDEHR